MTKLNNGFRKNMALVRRKGSNHIEVATTDGIEGVVTALHHIPNGEVWAKDEILGFVKIGAT